MRMIIFGIFATFVNLSDYLKPELKGWVSQDTKTIVTAIYLLAFVTEPKQ